MFKFKNVEVLDLILSKNTLTLYAYDYFAAQRSNYAFNVHNNTQIILNKNKEPMFFRSYINQSFLKKIKKREIIIYCSDQLKFIVPSRHPGGKKATVIFVEHADYQMTQTENLMMYGNSKGEYFEGEGIIGNNIPYTKSIFLIGKNYKFVVNNNEFVQPTYNDDKEFKKIIDKYLNHNIEIAAHNLGTVPDSLKKGSSKKAMKILENLGGATWTDHGSMPQNLAFWGWDKKNRFYILDELKNRKIKYLWVMNDYLPYNYDDEVININLLKSNNISPIFFRQEKYNNLLDTNLFGYSQNFKYQNFLIQNR